MSLSIVAPKPRGGIFTASSSILLITCASLIHVAFRDIFLNQMFVTLMKATSHLAPLHVVSALQTLQFGLSSERCCFVGGCIFISIRRCEAGWRTVSVSESLDGDVINCK